MIEGHGDDGWKYKATIRADFSSNVWHGGLDPGLDEHLQKSIATITHYPEAGAQTLQEEAAAAYGVAPDNVLVANGATEAIYLAAQAFRHKKIATLLTPSFAEYADACRLHGLDIQQQPWESVTAESHFSANLVFLCNPNNPTGAAMPLALLRQLLNNNPRAFFVIDESYIEFTRSTQTLLPYLDDHPNLLLLRSLTKSCRIPGLRIGFAIGNSEWIRALRHYKMPWSVNQLAIEAGLYIFRNHPRFILPLDRLLAAAASWRQQLQEATDWMIHATDTHYFLVSSPFAASVLKQHLIDRHGLLIRDASNFEGLTPYHFRIACQSPEHNQLLTDALRQCIQTGI